MGELRTAELERVLRALSELRAALADGFDAHVVLNVDVSSDLNAEAAELFALQHDDPGRWRRT